MEYELGLTGRSPALPASVRETVETNLRDPASAGVILRTVRQRGHESFSGSGCDMSSR